MEQLGFTLLEF